MSSKATLFRLRAENRTKLVMILSNVLAIHTKLVGKIHVGIVIEINKAIGCFRWSDQTPLVYINWAINEPNDDFGGQKCVQVHNGNGECRNPVWIT